MKQSPVSLTRYVPFLILFAIQLAFLLFKPELGMATLQFSWQNLLEMLAVVPPIFLLLGLLDVWVPREHMIKLLGEGSGLRGIVIAFLLGSLAAGPLYAAFPVAAVLLRKGGHVFNVLVFVGAWSISKIPMLLFEASAFGWPFALLRLALGIPVVLIIALITARLLGSVGQQKLLAMHAE